MKEHHHKNRTPKAPSARFLEQFQLPRTATPSSAASHANNTSDDESDDESSEESKSEPHSRRAWRHSKVAGKARPTQLQFYTALWTEVLERAKMYFRRHILLKSSFPSWDEVKVDLGVFLMQAIAAHEAKGGELKDGSFSKLLYPLACIPDLDSTGYYPKYKKDMHTLVSRHVWGPYT